MISIYSLEVFNPFAKRWEIFYCGKTNDVDRRLKEHKYEARRGKSNYTVYQTLRLIEKNKFDWELFVVDTFDTYEGQEKDYIIQTLLDNDFRDEPFEFVKALYLNEDIQFDTLLSNMKLGDDSPELKKYLEKKKRMKEHGFKYMSQLTEYDAREKSERLKAKVLKESEPKPLTMKERIKAQPQFIQKEAEKVERHEANVLKCNDILGVIKR